MSHMSSAPSMEDSGTRSDVVVWNGNILVLKIPKWYLPCNDANVFIDCFVWGEILHFKSRFLNVNVEVAVFNQHAGAWLEEGNCDHVLLLVVHTFGKRGGKLNEDATFVGGGKSKCRETCSSSCATMFQRRRTKISDESSLYEYATFWILTLSFSSCFSKWFSKFVVGN